MCSLNNNPKECPMYECGKWSEGCLHCKLLNQQKKIARISQLLLGISIIAYFIITIILWD